MNQNFNMVTDKLLQTEINSSTILTPADKGFLIDHLGELDQKEKYRTMSDLKARRKPQPLSN